MARPRVIRAFDLFCGGGGSSCGARLAGARTVGGIDIWPLATETFRLNNPDVAVYTEDSRGLEPNEVRKKIGRVDLLLASPECTNHSPAKGNLPRCERSRRTAFEVIRFARCFEPRWIVVENVVQMESWGRFNSWVNQLHELGYYTLVAKLTATDYGVAQTRRRLFVVCDRKIEPRLPRKRPRADATAKRIIQECDPNGTTWTLSPLDAPGRAKATLRRAQNAFREVGTRCPFIMVYYGSDGAGGWQKLDRPLRTITTLDRFALVVPNGSGHLMRMLQPPELAAAMGFPKTYKWPEASRRNKIRLIGNAVCPPVMKRIVQQLLRQG